MKSRVLQAEWWVIVLMAVIQMPMVVGQKDGFLWFGSDNGGTTVQVVEICRVKIFDKFYWLNEGVGIAMSN